MFQEDINLQIERGEELHCNPLIRIRQRIGMVFQGLKSTRIVLDDQTLFFHALSFGIWNCSHAAFYLCPVQRIFVGMVASSLSNG